ncbi:MAG: homocysteine S-methyltransferase family protein, partial [Acidobacteriota bacterium]|nr:homocysteine S-methyltransferase family protein [Acidobacteriota bacterium]
MNFKDFFWETDYILFDGAIGTQIYSRGIPKGHCYDELNISLPETIIDIHKDYISAGAKVITTNTFGANRFILEEYFALGEKTREINYYGARLAKQAAKDKAFVAGSIGPISRPLDTEKRISSQEIKDILEEQIEALLEGGVDLIIFETFACLDELTLAVHTARSIDKNLFIMAEISFPNSGLTLFGRNPYEVGLALESTAADTIGSNCGTGPQNVLESIKKMGSVTKKPLSAMPNAGLAQFIRSKFYYPHNPE